MKTYKLEITEKELSNVQVKRKLTELIMVRAQLQSTGNTFEISEAEAEVMKMVPLFTSSKFYSVKKYPNEIGKLKAQRVILNKTKGNDESNRDPE